uniref:C2H2-type domain-containing protein n=1 Tax=Palpitomonas bilix TaxID=652834 RepID=A0A7S3LTN8_9EUKA|mmetsp:Transcript_45577/g.117814  ORF Transcript_45577/g.117814 Transcript_45577/m.117814 type:complete len:313 (+) Transcript_45577:281-1219(+)
MAVMLLRRACIALVLFSFLLSARGFDDECSRENSRIARSHVDNTILPMLKSYFQSKQQQQDSAERDAGGDSDDGATNEDAPSAPLSDHTSDHVWNFVPAECPLHPLKDMFRAQEDVKHELHNGHYRCDVCGKVFRSGYHMDKHLQNRHRSIISESKSVCLADYCYMFGCDVRSSGRCNEKEVERKRLACQNVIHRCVPHSEEDHHHDKFFMSTHDELVRMFCETISCDGSEPLRAGYEEQSNGGTTFVVATMVSVLIVFSILIYYTVVFVYQSETRMSSDIRRRRRKPRNAVLAFLFDAWGGFVDIVKAKQD